VGLHEDLQSAEQCCGETEDIAMIAQTTSCLRLRIDVVASFLMRQWKLRGGRKAAMHAAFSA
jgi:hypothetical protein